MNISGGPEELATFIRALNDEPTFAPAPVLQPAKRAQPAGDTTFGFISVMVVMAGGFVLLALMMGAR